MENRDKMCDLTFLYQWKDNKILVYFNEFSEISFCKQTSQKVIYRKNIIIEPLKKYVQKRVGVGPKSEVVQVL